MMLRDLRTILLAATAFAAFLPGLAGAKEMPMWQGQTLSEAEKSAHEKQVEDARKGAGGKAKAAEDAMNSGWQKIGERDFDAAIAHFNAAWLLTPEDGAIYWGFAVASGLRGDAEEAVDALFKKAREIIGDDARLLTDWGRIYEARGGYLKARDYFAEAAALAPEDPEPHYGLMRIATQLGDIETVKQQQHILYDLKQK